DPLVVGIDADRHGLGVRIPSVGDCLGEDGRDVAVEVDAEVVEDVEVDRHLERRDAVRLAHAASPWDSWRSDVTRYRVPRFSPLRPTWPGATRWPMVVFHGPSARPVAPSTSLLACQPGWARR